METKNKGIAQQEQTVNDCYKPVIDLFELLLEWDMKDVQEDEEQKCKEVSEKF